MSSVNEHEMRSVSGSGGTDTPLYIKQEVMEDDAETVTFEVEQKVTLGFKEEVIDNEYIEQDGSSEEEIKRGIIHIKQEILESDDVDVETTLQKDECKQPVYFDTENELMMPIDQAPEDQKLIVSSVKEEPTGPDDNPPPSSDQPMPYWNNPLRFAAIGQFAKLIGKQRTEEEVSRCSTCRSGFPSKASLFKHLRLHSIENEHDYLVNKGKFYHRAVYRKRPRKDKEKKQQSCSTLNTKSEKGLMSSLCMQSQEKNRAVTAARASSKTKSDKGSASTKGNTRNRYRCPICRKLFAHTFGLQQHMKKHDQPKVRKRKRHAKTEMSLKCPKCTSSFANKSSLLQHVAVIHAGTKYYKCSQCDVGFWKENQLLEHINDNHKRKDWQCSTCDKTYESEIAFNIHIKTHAKVKQYDCLVCFQAFIHKHSLDKHMAKHQKHKCAECRKEFIFQRNLEKHMRKHTGEKPFKCSVCQKNFMFENSLKNHMKRHTTPFHGPKSFKCTVCQKEFMYENNLKNHMKRHTAPFHGPKSFKCTVCQKEFMYENNLKKHMKRHAPLHGCPKCDKSFYFKNNLTKHLRTHFPPEPLRCSCCSKTFKKRQALRMHRTLAHPMEDPLQCNKCGKSYRFKKCFEKHMKSHWNITCRKAKH